MRKLFIAGAYFDLITILALVHLLSVLFPSFFGVPMFAKVLVGILLSIAANYLGVSLGQHLISRIKGLHAGVGMLWRAWISLIVGGLIFLEALKHLVRWTQMDRPMPFMGFIPEGSQQIVHDVGWGAVLLVIAILVLKLNPWGKIIGVASSMIMMVSLWVSWDLLPEAIERQVIARRATQGIPVRPDEVAMMQSMMPTAYIAMTIGMIGLYLLCHSDN